MGTKATQQQRAAKLFSPSFVPSPQNSVCLPASLNAATTASLCLGACLAKTERSGTRSASALLAAGSRRTCRSSSEDAADGTAPPPPVAESPYRVSASPVAQKAADPLSLIFRSAARFAAPHSSTPPGGPPPPAVPSSRKTKPPSRPPSDSS